MVNKSIWWHVLWDFPRDIVSQMYFLQQGGSGCHTCPMAVLVFTKHGVCRLNHRLVHHRNCTQIAQGCRISHLSQTFENISFAAMATDRQMLGDDEQGLPRMPGTIGNVAAPTCYGMPTLHSHWHIRSPAASSL